MNFSDLKRQAAMVVVGIMSFVLAPAVQALNHGIGHAPTQRDELRRFGRPIQPVH